MVVAICINIAVHLRKVQREIIHGKEKPFYENKVKYLWKDDCRW